MEGQLALAMFVTVCAILLLGFPVALTLGGTALGFAALGILIGHFDPDYLTALTGRIFGTMGNETLVAVPLFILMGVALERAKISEDLLANMAGLFGERPGGLGVAVIVVGALLAASTGIVGATVVTMGVLALPSMLRAGYQPQLATGTICATGTLGQIIPPSIALVLLGDIMSSAYQQAQLRMNIINTDTVSVGDLFIGAMMPGITLVMMYLAYVLLRAAWQPDTAPAAKIENTDSAAAIKAVLPPLGLIVLVLGSILVGAATPTEAAGVGATGALLLALARGALTFSVLQDISRSTLYTTSMVFLILIGAAIFSLVFRGFGGDALIESFFEGLGGGPHIALLIVMLSASRQVILIAVLSLVLVFCSRPWNSRTGVVFRLKILAAAACALAGNWTCTVAPKCSMAKAQSLKALLSRAARLGTGAKTPASSSHRFISRETKP